LREGFSPTRLEDSASRSAEPYPPRIARGGRRSGGPPSSSIKERKLTKEIFLMKEYLFSVKTRFAFLLPREEIIL
jgi:hypothetical protein